MKGLVLLICLVSVARLALGGVPCPDGTSECPDENTCCEMDGEVWGCCPHENAVCCSDKEHCCPNGYECNVQDGTCIMRQKITPSFLRQQMSAIKPSKR